MRHSPGVHVVRDPPQTETFDVRGACANIKDTRKMHLFGMSPAPPHFGTM